MQATKKLTSLLRHLVALVEEEIARNSGFAVKLDSIMAALPMGPACPTRSPKNPMTAVTDVLAVLQEKDESELGFWARSLDIPTLKAVIRATVGLAKGLQRWTNQEKFVVLVIDQTVVRMSRGSALLPLKTNAPPHPQAWA